MKPSQQVGPILAGLTLALAGCESPKTTGEHAAKVEAPASPEGISTPTPPIEPSPVPSLPAAAPHADPEKKDEAKPAEKKAEPPANDEAKPESPK